MDVPKHLLSIFSTNNQSDFLNSFLEAVPSFVYLIDLANTEVVYLNAKTSVVCNYSSTELFTRDANSFPIINFPSVEFLFNYLQEVFKEVPLNETRSFVLKIKSKNETKIINNKATLIKKNESGTASTLLVFADDITTESELLEKTKQVQNQSNEAERLFNYGSWEWKVNNEYVVWSSGLFQIFGYDESTFESANMPYGTYQKHIPVDDLERVRGLSINALKEKKSIYEYEHEIIDNKGVKKQIAVRGKCFLDEKGDVVRVIGTSQDITEIKKIKGQLEAKVEELSAAYEELKKNKDLFKEAESLMNYGSFEWDVIKDEIQWSDGLKKLYAGTDVNNLPAKVDIAFYFTRIHDDDIQHVKTVIQEGIEKRQSYSFEHKIIDLDGVEKFVQTKGWVNMDNEGNVIKFIGNTVEVTELKAYEKELERKLEELNHSNQELEQFAYVASHDLKEPLRKITAFGDRLNQKYKQQLDEDARFYLTRMIDSANRMEVLMENLLSYSRLSRKLVSFEQVDLNKTLENVLSDLELKIAETNAEIYVDKMPILEASKPKMQQLFQNLVSNALKFVKPNQVPKVWVSASEVSKGEASKLGLDYKNKRYCKIIVKDEGIGFEPEYAERIFVIFQRLHGRAEFEGTGLGLAICKKIVENHQGLIYAESELGEGSRFVMYLPTHQPKS